MFSRIGTKKRNGKNNENNNNVFSIEYTLFIFRYVKECFQKHVQLENKKKGHENKKRKTTTESLIVSKQ